MTMTPRNRVRARTMLWLFLGGIIALSAIASSCGRTIELGSLPDAGAPTDAGPGG